MHRGELVARTRSIWLPVVVFLGIRLIGLLTLARFAQLRGQNLGDLLQNWDGQWMLALAEFGYDDLPFRFVDANGIHGAYTSYAFFPGYPMLVRALAQLPGISVYGAAIGCNVVLGCAAAVAAYRIGRLCAQRMPAVPDELAPRIGLLLTVLFAAAPMSVILSMAYTEALYCALAGWALVFVLERRWLLAGLATLLAGFCRPTAVVLIGVVILVAVVAIVRPRDPQPAIRERLSAVAAIIVAPIGWLTWILVVANKTDSLTGWFTIQTEGWGTSFDFGKQTFLFIDYVMVNGSDIAELSSAAIVLASLALVAVVWWQRMPWPIAVYGALVVLSVAGSGGLMMSRPRLLLPAFVILVPIAIALAKRSTRTQWFVAASLVVVTSWYGAHMVSVYPHAM